MTPNLAQMRLALTQRGNPIDMKNIGVNEAPNMSPKMFMTPDQGKQIEMPPPGGVATPSGMPIGGIDMSQQQPGNQLMSQPAQAAPAAPQPAPGGLPTPGQAPQMGSPQAPQGPTPPMGNMLSMMPQGQALNAMGGAPKPQQPMQKPPGMADGGSAKPKFAIAPAQQTTETPKGFTEYDKDNPTVKGLRTAFDEAIAHHLSLSPEDRAKNSIRAAENVAKIAGKTPDGKPKDLLGKNEKLLKSEKGYDGGKPVELPDGRGIETTGIALAPAYREGNFDTCPNHASCKQECLGKTSGNYFKLGGGKDLEEFLGPRLNSLVKTHAFMHDPHSFAVKLHDEISDAKAIAAQNGNHLGMRLNVLSDINPRIHKSIIEAHPDVTFYDYTKIHSMNPIASNHHYTYSSTGLSQPGVENPHSNWKHMRRRLEKGDNVSMVFSHKEHLPHEVHDQETNQKYKVIDGDTHDFRPLDMQPEGEKGVIIGLRNKNTLAKKDTAHIDSKGFTVHFDPQLKMAKNARGASVYERLPSTRISPKTNKPMLGETIPQNRSVNIQPQKSAIIPLNNDGERE